MRTPWRLATFLVSSLLLAPALLIGADVRPDFPEFTYDHLLTGEKTMAAFFEARLNDTDCRSQLDAFRKKLNEKEASLKKLVAVQADPFVIEEEEEATQTTRTDYLSLVDRCGLCAARQEKRRLSTPKSTEIWYVSDGSCYLDPAKFGTKPFELIASHLARVDSHPAYKGGFRNILEFVPVDKETRELHRERTSFDPRFLVFIAVKGPKLLGVPLSMQYLFKSTLTEKTEQDGKYWAHRFEGVGLREFQPPAVFITRASGEKLRTGSFPLTSVIGQWHADSRGFVRYYTAADFGTTIPFAESMARNILLDTLAQVYELGTGEKP